MLRGDFAGAWRESDAARQGARPDPLRVWDGQPIDNRRVMVRCLHGLGDSVQFLRYLPRLRALARAVILEVPPRLLELAEFFDGATQVETWAERAAGQPPEWDARIEIMESPLLFRTEIKDLPIAERYLRIPVPVRSNVAEAMGASENPRIGLAGHTGRRNCSRSIPFPLLKSLLNLGNFEFWNLQGGGCAEPWTDLPPSGRYRDVRECGDGVLALAATICSLDLVITVDTLAAHLAGALGKPAWLLLEKTADWRWMIDRSDSPWYPSLRLFRQTSAGDWQSVVGSVRRELASLP